jgi:hypothetical protein
MEKYRESGHHTLPFLPRLACARYLSTERWRDIRQTSLYRILGSSITSGDTPYIPSAYLRYPSVAGCPHVPLPRSSLRILKKCHEMFTQVSGSTHCR